MIAGRVMPEAGVQRIDQESSLLPERMRAMLARQRGVQISALGNVELLRQPLTGFFCSLRCPGMPIIKTFDLANELMKRGVPVIGGFHSAIEKECLRILLRGRQPIIICPARSIERMRIPQEWKTPLEEDRLLVISPFKDKHNRITKELSLQRNEFVATLASEIIIAHAAPAGSTMTLAQQLLYQGRRVWTLADESNEPLIALGARPIEEGFWRE